MKFPIFCTISMLALSIAANVSAAPVFPGMKSDFEDDTTMNWRKGQKSKSPPTLDKEPNGNNFLLVESFGDRVNGSDRADPDSRMTFFNDGAWINEYSTLGIIALRARMANMGEETLHMVYGIGLNDDTCTTNTPNELPSDGQWHDVTFSLVPAEMVCTGHDGGDSRSIEVLNSILDGPGFNFFFSTQDPTDFSGKIVGLLRVDDIEALTDTDLKYKQGSDDGRQAPILDLASDTTPDSRLIDDITETEELTVSDDGPLQITLEDSGFLHLASENQVELLRPVSAVEVSDTTGGASFNNLGYKRMVTRNGRQITFFSELQAPEEFRPALQAFGVDFETDTAGNVKITGFPDGSWFNLRAAHVARKVTESSPGIVAFDSDNLAGVTDYAFQFERQGTIYQQKLNSVPADWRSLRIFITSLAGFESTVIDSDGLIHATILGTTVRGRAGLRVNAVDVAEATGETRLEPMGDLNGDKIDDFMIIYPDGASQSLYILP